MALHDFDKAHAVHAALLSLLIAEPVGTNNAAVAVRVSSLCDAAVDAVNDIESRVAIRGVKSLAGLLYSYDGHKDVEAGSLRGAEAVRFRMMNALSTFRGRVEALERRPPSRPELPAIAPKKPLRVLVVEDNRDSAETLAKLLEVCGYSVSVAYTAMDGLETAKRTRPDVVLCDIGLPDSDGFALAEALHENPLTASARLVAVTAYGKDADRERSKRAGFALHLVKPVNPGALLRMLEEPQTPTAASSDPRVIDLAAHKKPADGAGSDSR
jgi:CheY-like chemotaxis protein